MCAPPDAPTVGVLRVRGEDLAEPRSSPGRRLAWVVLAGLLIGALILSLYVVLQPGKAASGGAV